MRDEEGKKLGLKPSEKSSGSKDNDVKMSDVEVITQPCYTHSHKKNMNAYVIMLNDLKSVICIQGSSNGSGEPSNAMSDEGIVSEPFQLVGLLLVSLGFIKCLA